MYDPGVSSSGTWNWSSGLGIEKLTPTLPRDSVLIRIVGIVGVGGETLEADRLVAGVPPQERRENILRDF